MVLTRKSSKNNRKLRPQKGGWFGSSIFRKNKFVEMSNHLDNTNTFSNILNKFKDQIIKIINQGESAVSIGEGNFNNAYTLDENYVLRLTNEKADTNDKTMELNGLTQQYKINGCANIAKIYSYGNVTVNGNVKVYAIMDNLKGGELWDYIYKRPKNRNKPRRNDVKTIMYNILVALNCIYKKGYCHNDIKSENIMLAEENKFDTVKLIDFGFMRECPDPSSKTRFGTHGYLHIDSIENEGRNDRIDMWALGILCLEMLNIKKVNGEKVDFYKKQREELKQDYYSYVNRIYNHTISNKPEFEELLSSLLSSIFVVDNPMYKTYTEILELPIFNETKKQIKKSELPIFDEPIQTISGTNYTIPDDMQLKGKQEVDAPGNNEDEGDWTNIGKTGGKSHNKTKKKHIKRMKKHNRCKSKKQIK